MKPAAFEYDAPRELDAALAALADDDGARPLAGGQSLVPMMNFRLAAPSRLVDLNRVDELASLEETEDGGLLIGAMTRQAALERDPRVFTRAPLLAEATPWIAHRQIRARGTVGGSVAHADPAAELPAVLLALGARATLTRAGPEGREERSVALGDFFLGPFFTSLGPGELLTAIVVPPLAAGEASAFEEVARRRGDYALAGVAARVRLRRDGSCADAAIALINAAPTPVLAVEAAARLRDEPIDRAVVEEAADAAAAEASPAGDMHGSEAYRRHLVRVLVRRTLLRAAGRARERPA